MSDSWVFRGTGHLAAEAVTRALRVAEKATLLGLSTVTVEAASKTLAELGVTVHERIKRLTLVPAAAGVFWARGAAATSDGPWLPAGGVELAAEKAQADALQFLAAEGTAAMLVVQEG